MKLIIKATCPIYLELRAICCLNIRVSSFNPTIKIISLDLGLLFQVSKWEQMIFSKVIQSDWEEVSMKVLQEAHLNLIGQELIRRIFKRGQHI